MGGEKAPSVSSGGPGGAGPLPPAPPGPAGGRLYRFERGEVAQEVDLREAGRLLVAGWRLCNASREDLADVQQAAEEHEARTREQIARLQRDGNFVGGGGHAPADPPDQWAGYFNRFRGGR